MPCRDTCPQWSPRYPYFLTADLEKLDKNKTFLSGANVSVGGDARWEPSDLQNRLTYVTPYIGRQTEIIIE